MSVSCSSSPGGPELLWFTIALRPPAASDAPSSSLFSCARVSVSFSSTYV